MTQPPFDFADLLCRAREGCFLASQEVYDRFNHAVMAATRRDLHHLLCSKVDPEDVAQNVWSVFFVGILPTHDFDCPQQLVGFLGGMARNLSLRENRRFLKRAAHDVHREQPLDDSLCEQEGALAATCEQWEQLMEGRSPEVRHVLRQLADGQSLADVAEIRRTTLSGLKRWLLRRTQRQLEGSFF